MFAMFIKCFVGAAGLEPAYTAFLDLLMRFPISPHPQFKGTEPVRYTYKSEPYSQFKVMGCDFYFTDLLLLSTCLTVARKAIAIPSQNKSVVIGLFIDFIKVFCPTKHHSKTF